MMRSTTIITTAVAWYISIAPSCCLCIVCLFVVSCLVGLLLGLFLVGCCINVVVGWLFVCCFWLLFVLACFMLLLVFLFGLLSVCCCEHVIVGQLFVCCFLLSWLVAGCTAVAEQPRTKT